MSQEEILEQLNVIFRDLFDDPALELTRETTADDIADWDSVNHINILVATESHFGIKFRTAETEELKNVGHLVDLVEQKLQAKKA